MELRLAVFTVQTFDLTPAEAAAELQRLGYDGVEWRITNLPASLPTNRNYWNGNVCAFEIDRLADEVAPLAHLSAAHGLALPSLGTYLDPRRLDLIEACCRAAQALGVPQLRVGLPGWDRSSSYDEALRTAIELWQPVVALGQRYGRRILAELHHGALIPSASAAVRFLGAFEPAQVGAIYDPGNMVHEGWEHPDIAIGALGPYLAHVHVKSARWVTTGQDDQGRAIWKGEMCRLLEGQVDWPAVFRSLQRVGYDGWFATEDFGAGETREKLAANVQLLRAWAAAV
ncbi:MAG: sugar phosphate isomerase/epimerase [Fimbriimonadaceae bacterium]|nr:sugar phosphate isomerase/epimerase [Fimbriimonadaceae bacterium]